MKTLLVIVLFLSASIVRAETVSTFLQNEDISISGPPNPIPNPGHPPEPIDTTPRLPYWVELWDHGTNVSQNSLLGQWKLVGRATNVACAHVAKDRFDEKGIKNNDASVLTAEFKDFPAPPPGSGAVKFGVMLSNIGKKSDHQGPFSVAVSEPQFSQWGYIVGGGLSTRSYWEYRCRNIQTKSFAGLGCMLTSVLRPLPPGQVWDNRSLQCAAAANGVVYIFTK